MDTTTHHCDCYSLQTTMSGAMLWVPLCLIVFCQGLDAVWAICPTGWEEYDSECYKFEPDQSMNRDDAINYCSGEGAIIAVLDTRDKLDWAAEIVKNHFGDSDLVEWFWVAGQYDDDTQKYYFDEGKENEIVQGSNVWQTGQPNSNGAAKHVRFVVKSTSSGFNDQSATHTYKPFCKKGPEEGSVRLQGGNNEYEGRVEIFVSGEWGSVCDKSVNLSGWPQVVCQELSFGAATEVALVSAKGLTIPEGLPIGKHSCGCNTSTASHLADCPLDTDPICTHDLDQYVKCEGP